MNDTTSIQKRYLHSLISSTDEDCDQMRSLRLKYPDISEIVVHITYCSRDKIDWRECKECQV